MGNAHVVSHRIGFSESKDGHITFLGSSADIPTFESHDGQDPRRLCVEFTLDHKIKLSHVTLKWVAQDCATVPPDSLIVEVQIPIAMETISSNCTLPRPWPPGAYRIDAYIGGKLEGSVPFRVSGDPRKTKFRTELSYNLIDTNPTAAVPFANTVTRDAHVVRVLFVADNIITATTGVSIEWIAEKAQGAPDNTNIAKAVIASGWLSEFKGNLSLPNGFPIGSYRVDLVIDGAVVHSAHFTTHQ